MDDVPSITTGGIEMVEELTKCPTCKRRTLVKEGEVLVCSQCKGRFPAGKDTKPERPPKPYKRNRQYNNIQERHRYLESHKDEICEDLLTIGQPATCKKWNIPYSTIIGLKNRWLTAGQRAQVAAGCLTKLDCSTVLDGRLPPFPPFSDNWEPAVQLKWLDLYGQLSGVHKALDKSG